MKTVNHSEETAAHREQGASLVEYALLCCLVVVAAIAAIRLLGTNISSQFSSVAGELG